MLEKIKPIVQISSLILVAIFGFIGTEGIVMPVVSVLLILLTITIHFIPFKESKANNEEDCILESGDYDLIDNSNLPDNIKQFAKRLNSNMKDAYVGISSTADSTIPLINQIAEIKKIAEHSNMVSNDVAAAGHELSMTIAEISNMVSESAEKSKHAVEIASTGAESISETAERSEVVGETMNMLASDIQNLEDEAIKISDVVKVINDLSDQTNLLALNAAIEAARAGEAGRGFAVVADEVRKLAERTRDATEEIGGVVKGITDSIRNAAEMSSKTSEAVTEQLEKNGSISESFNTVAGEIQEISSFVSNISLSIEHQEQAFTQITDNIENFRQDSELLNELGDTLSSCIGGLMDSIASIDSAVAHYKKGDDAAMFIRAKIAHANVLKAMQLAVIAKETNLVLPSHRDCGFGKAYYSDEYQGKFRSDPDFQAIEPPHIDAHKYGNLVVDAIKKGDEDLHLRLRDFSRSVDEFGTVMNRMINKLLAK